MGERFSIDRVLTESDLIFVDASSFICYYGKRKNETIEEKERVYENKLATHNFWINSIEKSGVNGFGKIIVPESIYEEITPIVGNGYKRGLKSHSNSHGRNLLDLRRVLKNSQKSFRKLKVLVKEKGLVKETYYNKEYLDSLQLLFPYIKRIQNQAIRKGENPLSEQDIDLFLNSFLDSRNSIVSLVSNDKQIRYLWGDVMDRGIVPLENFNFYHFVKDKRNKNFEKKIAEKKIKKKTYKKLISRG